MWATWIFANTNARSYMINSHHYCISILTEHAFNKSSQTPILESRNSLNSFRILFLSHSEMLYNAPLIWLQISPLVGPVQFLQPALHSLIIKVSLHIVCLLLLILDNIPRSFLYSICDFSTTLNFKYY